MLIIIFINYILHKITYIKINNLNIAMLIKFTIIIKLINFIIIIYMKII